MLFLVIFCSYEILYRCICCYKGLYIIDSFMVIIRYAKFLLLFNIGGGSSHY